MQSDFKKDIIRLMQSTKLLQSPLSELSEEEKGIAYNLLNRLVDGAVDENYTMLDYMQMARLYYNLGELSNNLFGEQDNPHYKKEDVETIYLCHHRYPLRPFHDISDSPTPNLVYNKVYIQLCARPVTHCHSWIKLVDSMVSAINNRSQYKI